MNDHYEDFLIREMTYPQNPEGELDPTESPGWGEEPNPYTDIIDPESLDYSRGVKIVKDKDGKLHFRPKEDGVHNPGSECALIPAEPGSLSDGKLRAPVNGDMDWPNYEPMQDDIGGNVILDRIQANEDWHGGSESNAYTASEAEARRKEWQDE